MRIVTICVTIVSVLYVAAGVGLYFGNVLYVLPSYDFTSYSYYTKYVEPNLVLQNFNIGIQIGLGFFCLMLLMQVIVLVWTFHQIKEVKEFNFTPELVSLCTIWVATTNVYLFLVIQGSYSTWFSFATC